MTVLLDGKRVSQVELQRLKQTIESLGISPHLVVLLVGDNPASQVYVKKKAKTAREIGLRSTVKTYGSNITQAALEAEILRLNTDPDVHGLLIQLPLPEPIDSERILSLVDPDKDVDGFHPVNMGRLLSGHLPPALPCTPAGMITMLKHYKLPIAGCHAVIIGRSNIVGKPMALLLLQENATVTVAHSKTADLPALCRQADILVAAIGRAEMITPDYIKPGAIVLDVGINRNSAGALVGDVAYESVAPLAGAITPVPGGVGPMTIATLLSNTVTLFLKSNANNK